MMLLISSQYPSPIHPVLHPPAVVISGVVGWLVELVKPPVEVVKLPVVVVDDAVVVEFPPLPPLGSRHEQTLQYWVFALGPQQSPPS